MQSCFLMQPCKLAPPSEFCPPRLPLCPCAAATCCSPRRWNASWRIVPRTPSSTSPRSRPVPAAACCRMAWYWVHASCHAARAVGGCQPAAPHVCPVALAAGNARCGGGPAARPPLGSRVRPEAQDGVGPSPAAALAQVRAVGACNLGACGAGGSLASLAHCRASHCMHACEEPWGCLQAGANYLPFSLVVSSCGRAAATCGTQVGGQHV